MFDTLRDRWRSFRDQPAGERFQRRYRRQGRRGSLLRKTVVMLAGCVLIVIGVAMLVLPGPGLLAILLGAGFIAQESLLAARFLDRIDLALSRRLRRRRAA